jgi:hypothetical protein
METVLYNGDSSIAFFGTAQVGLGAMRKMNHAYCRLPGASTAK